MTQQGAASSGDLRAVGERIDALITASASAGPVARERAEELVRLVVDLYGAGLERLLELLHQRGGLDDATLAALAEDDLVASLLLVHGLHPYDVATRVERALESVRPYLGSHGGDVELVSVHEETVQLRMLGSCDGCPSSSVTLKLAVEGAIESAAPEISTIEVEAAAPVRGSGPTIPVQSLFSRLEDLTPHELDGGASWVSVPELVELPPGTVSSALVAGVAVVACRVGADLFAFRDQCARCGGPLGGASVARRLGGAVGDAVLTCPHCHAHYAVRRAGHCLDAEELHLDPLPVLADSATVSVAVPSGVTV